ncbi:MAG: TRAP transporter large permease subunit [Chloroflexi bacterium]|nr:TRAP transporter large permease subunit [Chloroflexota bacterium]
MDWWLVLVIIFGSLILFMLTGLPVAFCFLLVNIIGVYLFWGGTAGLELLITSMFSSVAVFTLLPVPLFILMGEVMFMSGFAPDMIDALDKWLGRLPGRLGLETVAAGTIIATLSGSSLASQAMLTSTLLPEMEKRGYQKPMSLGPILGSGGLAIMIPPSSMGVILAWLGEISVGKLLIAITIPGLLMAALYATYIVGRCKLQPFLAPAYVVPRISLVKKLIVTIRYILPIGLVIFLVTGVIFLGVATPSEAAATGALSTFILAAMYGKINRTLLRKSITGALKITIMVLLIISGAEAYSQILAFSGASLGFAEFVTNLSIAPIAIIIALMLVLIVLGMFMSPVAIMMIAAPMFFPIVKVLGFDTVWFGVIFLLNMEMATTSPPFGLSLFVVKGVAGPKYTMGDVYRAALPFLSCDAIAMALIIAFPLLALWLPGLMRPI